MAPPETIRRCFAPCCPTAGLSRAAGDLVKDTSDVVPRRLQAFVSNLFLLEGLLHPHINIPIPVPYSNCSIFGSVIILTTKTIIIIEKAI